MMMFKHLTAHKIASKYLQLIEAFLNPRKYYLYSKKDYLYHQLSFSQEGEDLILNRIFENQVSGFYVDIGAHHPQRFSNTYHFYLKGWHGLNIDAMEGSMKLFNLLRPRDINVEIPISDQAKTLTYFEFNEPALNGFSKDISLERNQLESYKIIAQKELKTERLDSILEKYLQPDQEIDFMSIDVEGLDYEVLCSNNWDKFRPKAIIIEELRGNYLNKNSKISTFLEDKGYELFSKLVNSLIFFEKNS